MYPVFWETCVKAKKLGTSSRIRMIVARSTSATTWDRCCSTVLLVCISTPGITGVTTLEKPAASMMTMRPRRFHVQAKMIPPS